MDKLKAPGISIEGVHLLSCQVGDYSTEVKELSFNLGLKHKERILSEDKKTLMFYLSFDLMKGVETPPFQFTCDFCVTYVRDEDANMTWEEFTDVYALTHVIPYIREFVVNITSRMVVATLSIPPINVFALLREYEAEGTFDAQPDTETPSS